MVDASKWCYRELANEETTGFGKGSINIYRVISVLGILVNIGFLISSFIKVNKGKGKNKISSLEKLLMWLSGIEIFISIIWLIQTISFYSNLTILNNCTNCRILSHITIFLYIADWVILGLTIKQFKKIMLNPLDAILKPDKNIIYYLISAFVLASFATFLVWVGKLTGISVRILL